MSTSRGEISVIVLAGGSSSRMGSPKPLLPFGNEPLLARVVRRLSALSTDVVVAGAEGIPLPPLASGTRIVNDAVPGLGPLAGLVEGLRAARHPIALVCGGDHPFPEESLARFLVERARERTPVVPRWNGRLQPLFSVWSRNLLPQLEGLVAERRLGLVAATTSLDPLEISEDEISRVDPEGLSFLDVDDPADLTRALELLQKKRPRPEPMTGPSFRVFVYGTLRRGGRFHERYCRGARSIGEATVRGRLSRLPAGYPVIDVPAADVLARGSRDVVADVRRLAGLVPRRDRVEGSWIEIPGEVMIFDDPGRRLPALDELEGFDPEGASLYDRVVLPVRLPDGLLVPAWAYIRASEPVA